MLSILCVRLTIKVKVGIPESFKVGWYPPKKTGSSHLKDHVDLNQTNLDTNKLKHQSAKRIKNYNCVHNITVKSYIKLLV